MKGTLVLLLLALVATSCSNTSASVAAIGNATTTVPSVPTIAATVSQALPSASATSTPVHSNAAQASSAPASAIPLTQITRIPESATVSQATSTPTVSTTGWKTYTNSQLKIAVDYAPTWSVREESKGATFTSPQGDVVTLTEFQTGSVPLNDLSGEIRIPNQDCSTKTNSHGLSVRTCLETINLTYSATFTLNSSGQHQQFVSLTTHSRAIFGIFNAMVASMRSTR